MTATLELPELEAIARVRLAALPTPLEPAVRLSNMLGITLLIKRDDLTGLAMGGNKARKLEYLIADAISQNATMILATAAVQSNFCRMTAAAARRVGLRAGLLLRGTPDAPLQGNLLLDHLFGAEIRFVNELDPYASVHQHELRRWAVEERARGERPYVIQLHGGSPMGALATLAYTAASSELSTQCRELDVRPDHLYVPVGSGSTLAGLALGTRQTANPLSATRLVGILVAAAMDAVRPRIREFIDAAATHSGLNAPGDGAYSLDDTHRGRGYGVPTQAALRAIHLAAETEALLLNPVYTGKTFSALLSDVASGAIRPGESVIFVNTGGDPLLFSFAEQLDASNTTGLIRNQESLSLTRRQRRELAPPTVDHTRE